MNFEWIENKMQLTCDMVNQENIFITHSLTKPVQKHGR